MVKSNVRGKTLDNPDQVQQLLTMEQIARELATTRVGALRQLGLGRLNAQKMKSPRGFADWRATRSALDKMVEDHGLEDIHPVLDSQTGWFPRDQYAMTKLQGSFKAEASSVTTDEQIAQEVRRTASGRRPNAVKTVSIGFDSPPGNLKRLAGEPVQTGLSGRIARNLNGQDSMSLLETYIRSRFAKYASEILKKSPPSDPSYQESTMMKPLEKLYSDRARLLRIQEEAIKRIQDEIFRVSDYRVVKVGENVIDHGGSRTVSDETATISVQYSMPLSALISQSEISAIAKRVF